MPRFRLTHWVNVIALFPTCLVRRNALAADSGVGDAFGGSPAEQPSGMHSFGGVVRRCRDCVAQPPALMPPASDPKF